MFVKNELSAAVTTPLLAIDRRHRRHVLGAARASFCSGSRTVFISKGILISLCRQFAKAPRDDATTLGLARQDHRRRVPLRRHLGGGRLHQPRHAGRGGAHLHLRRAARRHLDAHAVRLDGDAHRLCRHSADDGRHRHALRAARQSLLLGHGGDGGRRAHLFHLADERLQRDRHGHARISRREGRADRRARAGQVDLRRSAARAPRKPTSPSRASSPP